MNNTNNQPVANGLPTSVSPVDQSPSNPPTTGRPPAVASASADLPQHDRQSTDPRLASAPATSDRAHVSVQHASTAAANPTQPQAGNGPVPLMHATSSSPDPAPSRPVTPPLDSVVPQAPDNERPVNRSSSPPPREPLSAPPQLGTDTQAVPPTSAPAAVTVPTSVAPAGNVTPKSPVYSDEDLDRLAQDTIAARPGVPGFEEVRAMLDLIDRMLQRSLTLMEIHGILVSRHGLKMPYKRFLALLTKVRKQSS